MTLTRRLFLSTVAAVALSLSAHAQTTFDLTILHTNDLHGHVVPFAYTETGRSPDEQASVGGAARRATLIRSIKKQTKNPVLVVDSGDTSTRGPLTNAYEGIADIEAMNAVGYDMAAIGNNEFKLKDGTERTDAVGAQSALLAAVRRAHFPWLCANAGVGEQAGGALLPGVQPFVVRQLGGVRVGFLGLTAPRSSDYPQTKGWWVGDPIAAAKRWIPVARRECDILIAVTHIGTDLDTQLAKETTGLDAIVGGDSHTFLYKALEVNGVPIVQTGEFGVNLGRFDLHFTKGPTGWKLARYDYALLPITSKLKEASDVKTVADSFAGPLQVGVALLPERYLGTTPAERERRTTQAVVDALQKATGADLAVCPQMEGFFEVFRHRELTRFDVFAALPFKNHVATVSLTGAELAALSGKIKNLIASRSLTSLNAETTYTVAVVDFVATSALGLAPNRVTDTGRDLRDAVIAGLGKLQ